MLLKQLKLENIRSYLKEEINFTEGSTLLSGDIGSGKSTILLAIEFAFFGTSRPDLPAEALLRKGAREGSVELSLQIQNQEIVIKRKLKKEKDVIKQMPGVIIINQVQKELMPVELKAEIISLLKYPEELANKNKNYIYRYTVYTPQEEMKQILQEDAEERLDVLRKIFNIDKYKIIRENLQIYLKKTRTDIAILKTKTEPLEDQKRQRQELIAEKETLKKAAEELIPRQNILLEQLQQQNKELGELELQQKEFLDLKQEYKTDQALFYEKKEQYLQLNQKKERLKLEITQLSLPENQINKTLEQTKAELKEKELQKNYLLTKKTIFQEKLSQLKENLKKTQFELNEIIRQTDKIKEKERLQEELSLAIANKKNLQQNLKDTEEQIQEILKIITTTETVLFQSKELQEKIGSLNTCPTCLQEVSSDHKHKITSQEQDKIVQAEQSLLLVQERKKAKLQQKELLQKELEQIVSKENQLIKINFELYQLQEKKELGRQKEEQLNLGLIEIESLKQKIEEIDRENNLERLDKEISQIQEYLHLLSKKQILERNVLELNQQINQNEEQKVKFIQKIMALEEKLANKKDLSLLMAEKKRYLARTTMEEKELALSIARLQTQINSINKYQELIEKSLDQLNLEKNKLILLKETYHWLEEYLLKLTYTIEKQVMANIHSHFNQIFQDWFSVLIDDENVSSRIDESFTPIIEQNGYDISFPNLSGGEKTSAALAYRLALNRAINDVVNEINTKDLLILDEPTDGFSTEQLDKVRDILEKLKLKQTIIVSHESKIESFVEKVIRINKIGHVSSVI
ncbi:MAG: SMC family ATPase [Nanoarchaeota archaeon]